MRKARLSIWFFIAVLLCICAPLIPGNGSVEWMTGRYLPGVQLAQLYMPVWWGGLVTALGLFYLIKFWPRASEDGSASRARAEAPQK